MPILNELQNYSILNIFKHLFQKALKVLYVYFNIYLHYITDLGGQVFLLTDFVFCFIVFPNTFAEAAMLYSRHHTGFRTADNTMKMPIPPLSKCLALST